MEIRDDEVSRIDVVLADDRALAFLDYTASGQLTADLDKPGRQTVRAGSVRVVPSEAVQIRPSDKSGTIVCQWVDPVEVDEIQLLDINDIGGELQLFDLAGKSLARRAIADLGPNSFQKLRLQIPDVARLEIHLPGGGALAEMHFTWQRRVRSAWQRDHPRLAKVVFNPITDALSKPEIRYSIKLTMISCTITAILSLWVAVPIGYLMSRHRFPGRNLIDAVLDIPIVLPPLVVGLSLLILFQYVPTSLREAVVYQIPAVIIAQFSVACAFAVRTMRATFDQIDARHEQVALTLGCSRMQAFGMIVIPEAKRGIVTAATLAWARSLGEFGPLLVFAGTTRNKTEVLSTTVFLELNVGNLGAAVAVSLIMVAAAVMVLVLARAWGTRNLAV
jgi:molybdate transport system permease protein